MKICKKNVCEQNTEATNKNKKNNQYRLQKHSILRKLKNFKLNIFSVHMKHSYYYKPTIIYQLTIFNKFKYIKSYNLLQ